MVVASLLRFCGDPPALGRGGLLGGVAVSDFFEPRLAGGGGGVWFVLARRLEGGSGGGAFSKPFLAP